MGEASRDLEDEPKLQLFDILKEKQSSDVDWKISNRIKIINR